MHIFQMFIAQFDCEIFVSGQYHKDCSQMYTNDKITWIYNVLKNMLMVGKI